MITLAGDCIRFVQQSRYRETDLLKPISRADLFCEQAIALAAALLRDSLLCILVISGATFALGFPAAAIITFALATLSAAAFGLALALWLNGRSSSLAQLWLAIPVWASVVLAFILLAPPTPLAHLHFLSVTIILLWPIAGAALLASARRRWLTLGPA